MVVKQRVISNDRQCSCSVLPNVAVKRWMVHFMCFVHCFLSSNVRFTSCSLHPYSLFQEVIIPHDCSPGFLVTSLEFMGQSFFTELVSTHSAAGSNVTHLFAVLHNGDLVTIADVSNLLGQEIQLSVSSRFGSNSWTDVVFVQVRHGDTVFTFTKQLYEGTLPENSERNSFVRGLDNLKARRKDRVVMVRYSLISGRMDLFQLVEVGDGLLGLESLVSFDYEVETQYLLTLMAVSNDTDDKPIFARIRIFIENANDNSPVFENTSYYALVDDLTPPGGAVVQLVAFDADGDFVKYSFEPENDDFGVDHNTGSVYVKQSCGYLELSSYRFVASATDLGGRQSSPAMITIETNCPDARKRVFPARSRRDIRPVKQIEIPESMYGDLLDLENGPQQLFSFKDPPPKDLDINPVTGTVRLRDGRKLDYESQAEINFVVVISRVDDVSCESYPISSYSGSLLHLTHSIMCLHLPVLQDVIIIRLKLNLLILLRLCLFSLDFTFSP